MDLYFYDPEYKFYTYTQSAEEVEGEYLIAQNSTPIEPPIVGEGCLAIFDDEASVWSAIIDNRGTYYNTTTGELSVFQNPNQSTTGFTKVVPPHYNQSTHHLVWELDKWVIVADVEVPSTEVTALSSVEEKINLILKSNKVELRDYLLSGLADQLTPLDLFGLFGISVADIKEILGLDLPGYESKIYSVIEETPGQIIYSEFNKLQDVTDKLDLLGIDPYELKDLLDNLPPQ